MDRTERLWALSSLWAAAREVYPYFDRLETDWDQAYREYIPRLTDAEDGLPVWLMLCSFLRLLNDGHSTVILPKALREGNGVTPFRFTHVGDRFLITEAAEKSLLLREARAIDGLSIAELVGRLDRYKYTAKGHPYRGHLESWLPVLLSGRDHVLETDGGEVPFAFPDQLPPLLKAPEPESRRPFQDLGQGFRLFAGGVLCARVDDMQHVDHAAAFQKVLAETRPRAVIFDVRRNMGGMTLCGARYAQPFFEGSFGGSRKWTQLRRAADAAGNSQLTCMGPVSRQRLLDEGIVKPEDFAEAERYARRTQYELYNDAWESPSEVSLPDCPVLLLTGRDTISAAEDFTCFFKANQRGRTMGERTFGSTGNPYLLSLPEGGRGQVVSVGYEMVDGTPFMGVGIEPDVPCPPRAEDVQTGWDRTLDLALDQLA